MSTAIVILGIPPHDAELFSLANKFGWTVRTAANLADLKGIGTRDRIVGVFFAPNALNMSCEHAAREVIRAAPLALPIVCQRFSEPLRLEEMSDCGVFYALHLPFARHELLQALGFLEVALLRKPARLKIVERKAAAS